MESINELRQMLQGEKVNPEGWRRPLGYKFFQRGPSIYATRLLIKTNIQPTTITKAGIVVGLIGCALLLNESLVIKLSGLSLLYVNILSDKVDGELARYKKIYSLVGIYWDEINHLVIPPLFWFSLTYGISEITIFSERILLGVSFVGVLSIIWIRVANSLPQQIYSKKFKKYRHLFTNMPPATLFKSDIQARSNVLKTVARMFHQLQDFFILIFITFILLVVERMYLPDYFFHPLIAYFVVFVSGLLFIFALEHFFKKSESVIKTIVEIDSLA